MLAKLGYKLYLLLEQNNKAIHLLCNLLPQNCVSIKVAILMSLLLFAYSVECRKFEDLFDQLLVTH